MLNTEFLTFTKQQILALQNKRFKKLIKYTNATIPFYAGLFSKNNLVESQIKNINDINKIPFTTKDDLRLNYPFGLISKKITHLSRIHCSSGTTGKPTVVGYSNNDLKLFSDVVARSLLLAGLRKGMTLQNAYGYGLFTGGLGFHYGAEHLGLNVIPSSGGMTERQILLLQDLKADSICSTPSYAQTLAEEICKKDLSEKLNLKYAILGAEPWTETIRKQIEDQLNIIVSNHYGLSEIIGPGVAQEDFEERGTGSYIWEDHFYPEIVDPKTGETQEEGKLGVLVLTSLTKEAMPLIRYWTNDITNLYFDSRGKRNFRKIGPIVGRADEMLIIRGVNFFHTQIESLLNEFPDLSANYQIIVSKHNYLDTVEINVELDNHKEKSLKLINEDLSKIPYFLNLSDSLRKKVKDIIGLTMNIKILPFGSIPRSDGGKMKRVIDLRKKG